MKLHRYLFSFFIFSYLLCFFPAYAQYTDATDNQVQAANSETDDDAAEPSRDDASHVFHVYDDVDLVSTIKFDYGKPNIVIKSVYPQLATDTDQEGANQFNDLALQLVNDEVSKFRDNVKSRSSYQKKMKGKVTNNLYVDYDASYVKSKQDHLLSVRFSIQGFIAGMAHPYHYHRVLNFNLDTNEAMTLDSLFVPGSNYLDLLAQFSQTILAKRLPNKDMIAHGTTPTRENYALWNIKTNGILITFDEYKVAPYVYGTQTVLVPYRRLLNVLSQESSIADCVAHKRRCKANNLLTGGFINEAINARHGGFNPVLSQS